MYLSGSKWFILDKVFHSGLTCLIPSFEINNMKKKKKNQPTHSPKMFPSSSHWNTQKYFFSPRCSTSNDPHDLSSGVSATQGKELYFWDGFVSFFPFKSSLVSELFWEQEIVQPLSGSVVLVVMNHKKNMETRTIGSRSMFYMSNYNMLNMY